MGVKSLKLATVCLALFVPASIASAQWDAPTEAGTSTTATVAPTPPPAPAEMVETPPPLEGEPAKKGWQEAGFTWALQIGVPVFLDVDRDIVKAGADISWFGGADFGYFVIGGTVGIGWNPIDLNGVVVDGTVLSGRSPVTRIILSVPEARFQVPGLKVVLPYISGAFDINFWNFRETQAVCDFYYCSRSSVYRFTPGFTGRGGVGFEVKNGIYIDVGLRYSFTGKGDFFQQSRWWLTPYVGVLVRRRK